MNTGYLLHRWDRDGCEAGKPFDFCFLSLMLLSGQDWKKERVRSGQAMMVSNSNCKFSLPQLCGQRPKSEFFFSAIPSACYKGCQI